MDVESHVVTSGIRIVWLSENVPRKTGNHSSCSFCYECKATGYLSAHPLCYIGLVCGARQTETVVSSGQFITHACIDGFWWNFYDRVHHVAELWSICLIRYQIEEFIEAEFLRTWYSLISWRNYPLFSKPKIRDRVHDNPTQFPAWAIWIQSAHSYPFLRGKSPPPIYAEFLQWLFL